MKTQYEAYEIKQTTVNQCRNVSTVSFTLARAKAFKHRFVRLRGYHRYRSSKKRLACTDYSTFELSHKTDEVRMATERIQWSRSGWVWFSCMR